MCSYPKPLRRKLGVLTLVMACGSMVFWVRGHIVSDFIDSGRFLPGSHGIVIKSNHGAFTLMKRQGEALWMSPDGQYHTFQLVSDINVDLSTIAVIPYWSIVIPLTLVSAYLLLSKPVDVRDNHSEQSNVHI